MRAARSSAPRWRRFAPGVLLALFVAGCGSSMPADEGGPRTVRVATSRHFTNAPLLIAKEAGFFEEEGLRLELLDAIGNTGQLVPPLSQGRIDVLAGGMSVGLVNAIGRGAPVRLIADKGHYSPRSCSSVAVVARRGLLPAGSLATAEDLRGRRIALGSPSSGTRYFFEALLDSFDLRESDLVIEYVPSIGSLEALNSGAVDFMATLEPTLTHLQAAGHTIAVRSELILPDFQFGIIAFGPTLLEEDRDAGHRFARAYLRGVRQYAEGKTERNLELLARATRLDRDLLDKVCWPAIRADGRISAESLARQQEWAVRKGFVKEAFPPELLWDNSFVDSAAAAVATSP